MQTPRLADMDLHLDWERLARYVTGQCTPEERGKVEEWIAREPTRAQIVRDMRTIWENAHVAPSGWDAEAAWQEVSCRLERTVVSITPRAQRPVSVRVWGLRAAAALALLLGAGLGYRALFVRPATPVAMKEYVTQRGQRAEFRLRDGTRVVLSVASRLRVPADYGRRRRDVYLEGEGYFEVRQDPRRFAVHTANTVTEDLGTRFDVRSYENDTTVQVVVAEGRVAVRARDGMPGVTTAEVAPGQVGIATAGGAVAVRHEVDRDRYFAWTEGRLVFQDTPLGEAIPQLGRWYDLDLRFGDSSLAGLPLTATFKDQTTTQVLDLVAQALGLRLTREGRTVTFYRRSKHSR